MMSEKLVLVVLVVAAAVLALAVQIRAGGAGSGEPSGGAAPGAGQSAGPGQAPVGHHAAIPAGFSVIGDGAKPGMTLRTATFGAGCFWGVEARFRETKGVIATAVGYSGGGTKAPTYKDVCTDTTGHAEVVEVIYDAGLIGYDELLRVFWENHNPTTLNRQGPDEGSQYRSVIFYHDAEQQSAAEASKRMVAESGKWKGRTIVTQIAPAQRFYAAEEYHQRYLEKRGLSSCHN